MPDTGQFEPVRVMELEIGGPIGDVRPIDPETGRVYARALCLVRLHTHPLGVVELTLGDRGLSAAELARAVWRGLEREIAAHLRRDGLPETALGPHGLPSPDAPRCLEARRRVLADAPFATVAVCTRDRPDSLPRALRSLTALRYPRYEILVVDNAPRTDATAELIRTSFPGTPIRYVRADRPGLSWARNRAIAEARGDVLAFTDDDVEADGYWLAELVAAFGAVDNVACTTGLTPPIRLETRAEVWREQFAPFQKRGFERQVFDMAEHRPDNPAFPFAGSIIGSGNNMAFRTSVLRSLGGFDPALGAGTKALAGEDFAAFFRVLTAGYRAVYTPSAIAWHMHRQDYPALRKQLRGYGISLTALLAKYLIDDPRLLAEFAARAPYGLYYMLGSRSPKNKRRRRDFPRELTLLERKGILYGPLAYVLSLRETVKLTRAHGPIRPGGGAGQRGQGRPIA